MYQIGICDDEPLFLEHISALTAEVMLSLGIPCRIHTFRNEKELSAYFSKGIYPPPGQICTCFF